MTTPSDERSIGKLEGRLDALERDVAGLRQENAATRKELSGKLDDALVQISRLHAQLAGVLTTRSTGWKLASVIAGASGWVMVAYGMMQK